MLEPRLYPLLETLTGAGLDWLAQEVIAGALAGDVPEESPEALQAARSVVFRLRQDSGAQMPARASREHAMAFSGEQQIDWAARHVSQRLEEVLDMFKHSIDSLDELVDADRAGKSLEQPQAGITLVLTDGDAPSKADRKQIAAAMEGLGHLRDTLGSWAADARRGERT